MKIDLLFKIIIVMFTLIFLILHITIYNMQFMRIVKILY